MSDPAPTTHWSRLLTATDRAERHFCERYRTLVVDHFQRKGLPRDDAEDLAQAFFTRALERDFLACADPTRGRFRALLRRSATHFLLDHWKAAAAAKRALPAPLDTEPAVDHDPAFDADYALAVYQRVWDRLRARHAAAGTLDHYRVVRLRFASDTPPARIATLTGLDVTRVYKLCERGKTALGQLLLDEVRPTVAADELPAELAYLLRCLAQIPGGSERAAPPPD